MDDLEQASFQNVDKNVVNDFGVEWSKFNYQHLSQDELFDAFNQYFHIFPFDKLGQNAIGFDMGCGSGRWARVVSKKVNKLHCIDASKEAILQAQKNLQGQDNCSFECASVSNNSLGEETQDFGYCLGVLHHIPDTQKGLNDCVKKLKKGAPFLLYLYYRFDNKPLWYKLIWKISDYLRKMISSMPCRLKLFISHLFAITIYWPLAKIAGIAESLGLNVQNLPLSDYRNKSFYFMKTDALDRFGTRLEKRFTQNEMRQMMLDAGLQNIEFSNRAPYWVALGYKK